MLWWVHECGSVEVKEYLEGVVRKSEHFPIPVIRQHVHSFDMPDGSRLYALRTEMNIPSLWIFSIPLFIIAIIFDSVLSLILGGLIYLSWLVVDNGMLFRYTMVRSLKKKGFKSSLSFPRNCKALELLVLKYG